MQAHRALWQLAATREAERLLGYRLRAVVPISARRLDAFMADLGSTEFIKRQEAEESLYEARESAADKLREALRKSSDLEVRRRVERLLRQLHPRAPRRLREVRAVMVLEARGTPPARALLARLAAGIPSARLTQEASAALKRLDARR
jgi:hypothetical protein